MTGIKIVCVGRVKEDFFRDGIAAYVKEIRKKYSMDIMECPDEPTPDQCPASVERQIREMEGERILSQRGKNGWREYFLLYLQMLFL